MTIDQVDVVDFIIVDKVTGDISLVVSDHLPWDVDEGEHLLLLQEKLNKYLAFVEGGEILEHYPDAGGRAVVLKIVGKFAPSPQAERFLQLVRSVAKDAGFGLEFELLQPN